ncbi:DUF4136 domain-containing protein [Thalassotalea sp. LPB0316]|uniref:DUF4136 domain-containing protein n=1 Tax=Thalassotalea sp. LPB0316 TaxID=2769490 RepID=UPI001868F3B2|nr:DUF4136 domain-containing protein [Thalassotalea sp. LPB0316]QOL24660.1 DUF4136 domain-containing protein [Thalassotalea sp. LPB0316]
MQLKNIFSVIALSLVLAACSSTNSAKVNADKNDQIDTSGYKTFAWISDAKTLSLPIDLNPVMQVRVEKAIEQAFINKGYELIDDREAADFTIAYTVGSRDKIKVDSYPASYHGQFGWGRGYYPRHSYYGVGMGTETQVRSYTEGKLAIDVFDVKSKQPAWHGWAVKRLKSGTQEAPTEVITQIVDQVISQFNVTELK